MRAVAVRVRAGETWWWALPRSGRHVGVDPLTGSVRGSAYRPGLEVADAVQALTPISGQEDRGKDTRGVVGV